jgi:hypothetical protein
MHACVASCSQVVLFVAHVAACGMLPWCAASWPVLWVCCEAWVAFLDESPDSGPCIKACMCRLLSSWPDYNPGVL